MKPVEIGEDVSVLTDEIARARGELLMPQISKFHETCLSRGIHYFLMVELSEDGADEPCMASSGNLDGKTTKILKDAYRVTMDDWEAVPKEEAKIVAFAKRLSSELADEIIRRNKLTEKLAKEKEELEEAEHGDGDDD